MVGTFRLSFNTNMGKSIEISIPRANLQATEAEVIAAMDSIISSGVVFTANGRPTQRLGARLIKTDTTNFAII